jgi:hypothetical protein
VNFGGTCVQADDLPQNYFIVQTASLPDGNAAIIYEKIIPDHSDRSNWYVIQKLVETRIALKCPDDCLQCSTTDECHTCNPGLFRHTIDTTDKSKTFCLETCPPSYQPDSYNICTRISCGIENCHLCLNAKECLECKKFSLSENMVIPFFGKCLECGSQHGLITKTNLIANKNTAMEVYDALKVKNESSNLLYDKNTPWSWKKIRPDGIESNWLDFTITYEGLLIGTLIKSGMLSANITDRISYIYNFANTLSKGFRNLLVKFLYQSMEFVGILQPGIVDNPFEKCRSRDTHGSEKCGSCYAFQQDDHKCRAHENIESCLWSSRVNSRQCELCQKKLGLILHSGQPYGVCSEKDVYTCSEGCDHCQFTPDGEETC